MNLADIINGGLYALDTPGALTRGVLSGRPGERVDGRDFLEGWGVVGQNQAGLDWGDVAGYAAGVATDPLTYVSGGALLKALRGPADDAARGLLAGADLPPSLVGGWGGGIDDAARAMPDPFFPSMVPSRPSLYGSLADPSALNALPTPGEVPLLGYTPAPKLSGRRLMPDEAFWETKAQGDLGPKRLYHGSPFGHIAQPDPTKWSDPEDLLFGQGHYMTDNPGVASSYARQVGVTRQIPVEEIMAKYTPGSTHYENGDTFTVLSSRLTKFGTPDIQIRGSDGRMTWYNPRMTETVPSEPAVNSYFLDSRRPFDMTQSELPPADAIDVLKSAMQLDGHTPMSRSMLEVEAGGWNDGLTRATPEEFYGRLENLLGGKGPVNEALQGAGYDAIRHVGGTRAGGGRTLHDVWIALHPDQVYEPFLQSAVQGKWANPPSNLGMLAAILAGGGAGLAMQPQ